jgi:hypothetical protein
LREALKSMGRNDLIGNGKHHLTPTFQPKGFEETSGKIQSFKTKHTGFDHKAAGARKVRPNHPVKGKERG